MTHTSTHTTGLQVWKTTANKAPRSDIYVQMRQVILMAAIFQQAPKNLFRINLKQLGMIEMWGNVEVFDK